MASFVLKHKTISDLALFDQIASSLVPEYDGLLQEDGKIIILLTEEPTPEIINTINNIDLNNYNLTSTDGITTSSTSLSAVEGMSITPPKGTYLIFFSGSIYTGGASAEGEFGIYVDDELLIETRREVKCNLQLLGGLVTISLNSIGIGTYTGSKVELDGTNVVDIKFKSNNGGTIGFNERTMTLMRVL